MINVDLIWILGALIIPLIGVAFSMLKSRIDRIEQASSNEAQLIRAELDDVRRHIRHEVRDINDHLIQSLVEDRQFSVNKLIETMEVVADLLQDNTLANLDERRRVRKADAG